MARRRQGHFKADDIWHTPDDGYRYEVIGGALFRTERPPVSHQLTLGHLSVHIGQHIGGNRCGEAVMGPIGVVLDDSNAVQPDLVYISTDRFDIIEERGVFGAPDLVVEVLWADTDPRDRGIKLRRYEATGVPYYWMLDPRSPTLEARRLDEDRYELTGVYGAEDIFRPDLFPGLEISICDLCHSQFS